MRKSILVVIAVVMTFLAFIMAYTMTPPDASNANKASAPAATH